MEHTHGHSVAVSGDVENHSTEAPEELFPVVLPVAVFLFLITDAFLFREGMLEINLIVLMISMLIYAFHVVVYLLRNRNKFRVHFLLSTAISGVLSFLFWNIYEIWGIEIAELLFGILIVSLCPLGVFSFMDDTKGETTTSGRGALYSVPTNVAVFVFFAAALAPPLW